MLPGYVAENQVDATNTVLASQKLLAYDTPEARQTRNGTNFSMYEINLGGTEFYPTAQIQGPHQINQVTPGWTKEIVNKIQSKLRGIEMAKGRFDLTSNSEGNMAEHVRFPAVCDTVSAEQKYIPKETWATATINSLLKDNRKTQPCQLVSNQVHVHN